MIHLFKSRRVLAVPSNWLNAVAAWCLGVHSPTGTISVKNTACPKSGSGSLALDVNIEKVAAKVEESLGSQRELSKTERALIKGLFASMFDQKIVTFKNNLVGIDTDRMATALETYFAKVQANDSDDVASSAPKSDGTKIADDETTTEKRTRIGSSAYAARADHQHPLNCDDTNAPEDVVSGDSASASCGTSTTYARSDHVHKLGDLDIDASDVTYGSTDVGSQLESDAEDISDHETRIAALENAEPVAAGVSSVNTKTGDVTLTASDINATGGTIQSVLTELDSAVDDIDEVLDNALGSVANYLIISTETQKLGQLRVTADSSNNRYVRIAKNSIGVVEVGTIPSSDITDSSCTSGGDCLAYFTSEKKLAHLGNSGITVSKANALAKEFTFSGSGANMVGVLNYLAVGASAAPSAQKAVGFAANSTVASLIDVASVDTSVTSTSGTTLCYENGKLVIDGNKYLKATTSSTGVVYLSAGTMSMKTLNGANGVAGLDSNGKVAIGNLPTGSSSTTVALGNHTHAYGSSSLTGFGTAAAKDTGYFATASHTHGFITNDGCLSNCTSADCLVVTTTGGKITHSNSGPRFSDVAELVSDWKDAGKSLGAVSSVDGQTGAVTLSNTYAAKSHQHSVSDITSFSSEVNSLITTALNGYATESYVTTQLATYATESELDTISDSVLDLTDIVEQIVADYVTSADLAEYATQTWVSQQGYVTDEDLGEYLTTDDISSASISALASGVASSSLVVVTGVTWNGTTLSYKKKTVTITQGVITAVSDETTTTIDTPAVVTWS